MPERLRRVSKAAEGGACPPFKMGSLVVAILRDASLCDAPQDEDLFRGEILDPHGEERRTCDASRTMRSRSSLRAQRSNPESGRKSGLLRFARNDAGETA